MDRCVGAAARLPVSDRKDLAIQALARSATISDLAARQGVSRKFVCQQTHKAVAALDDAFLSATPDHEVLFEVAVITRVPSNPHPCSFWSKTAAAVAPSLASHVRRWQFAEKEEP